VCISVSPKGGEQTRNKIYRKKQQKIACELILVGEKGGGIINKGGKKTRLTAQEGLPTRSGRKEAWAKNVSNTAMLNWKSKPVEKTQTGLVEWGKGENTEGAGIHRGQCPHKGGV